LLGASCQSGFGPQSTLGESPCAYGGAETIRASPTFLRRKLAHCRSGIARSNCTGLAIVARLAASLWRRKIGSHKDPGFPDHAWTCDGRRIAFVYITRCVRDTPALDTILHKIMINHFLPLL